MKKLSRFISVILAIALIIGTGSTVFVNRASADASEEKGLAVINKIDRFVTMDPEKENALYTKIDIGGTVLYAFNSKSGFTNFRAYGDYNGWGAGYYPVNLRYERGSNEVTIQLYQVPRTVDESASNDGGKPTSAGNWPDEVEGFEKAYGKYVRQMTNIFNQTEYLMYGKIANRAFGYYHVNSNGKAKAGSLPVDIQAKKNQMLSEGKTASEMPVSFDRIQEAVYVTTSNNYRLEVMTCGASENEPDNRVFLTDNIEPLVPAQEQPQAQTNYEIPVENEAPAVEYGWKAEHVMVNEELPFETMYVESNDLLFGERQTVQTGHVGIKNVFYTVIYDKYNNEINRYVESESIVVAPVDTIVVIGTEGYVAPIDTPTEKPNPTEKTDIVVTVTENTYSPIAVTTEYIDDADRYADEGEIIVKQGKEGTLAVRYTVTYINGVEASRVKAGEFIVEAMQPTVISRGTKHHSEGTEIVTETQPIAITTEYQADPNRFEDEGETVVNAGSEGVLTITYKVTVRDGVEISREKTGETVTKEMEPKVISRGTKQHTETVETVTSTEAIPFTTEYWDDFDRFVDEGEKVQTEGSDGIRTITYKVTMRDGVEVSREKTGEAVTKEMQPKVILRGAKQHTENVETVTENQPIAITTEYVEDATRYADEGEAVVKNGSEGVLTVTYKVTKRDGVEVSREKTGETVTKEMEPKVISRGTKQRNVETKYETVTEVIPFETVRQNDEATLVGTERVWREGENGEKTVTYIVKYVDGVAVSREVDSENITKEPTAKIVLVGTAAPVVWNDEYEYVDLSNKYTLRGDSDPELEKLAAEHAMKMAEDGDAFHAGSGYLESVGKFASEEEIEEMLVNHVPAIEDSKNYGYGCVRVRSVGSDGRVSGWTYYAVLYGSADEVGN